jgi:nucleolin
VRAFAQPSKQLATFRAPSRIVSQISKPTLQRSFYQSRWLAEERRVGAEDGVSPTEPPSAEEMSEIKEESVASSEVTGGVQGALRHAAATVSDALSGATSSGAASEVVPTERDKRVIYVGNLSFDVREADLESEFSKYGNVTSARCISDQQTGQQKGFGFIEFSSAEEAARAVEGANDVQLLGRRMNVQLHIPKERRPRRGDARDGQFPSRRAPREPIPVSKTLFIGNMSYQMSDKDLNGKLTERTSVAKGLKRSMYEND